MPIEQAYYPKYGAPISKQNHEIINGIIYIISIKI